MNDSRRTRISVLFLLLTLLLTLGTTTFPVFSDSGTWRSVITKTPFPSPGIGCFEASYPNVQWISVQCSSARASPENTGSGNDVVGNSGTTLIGTAEGFVWSMSGFRSENDSIDGSNWYSIQLNSQKFAASNCPYGGHSSGYTCWEQFIFENNGCSNCHGYVSIQYWLLSYYGTYGSCPTNWSEGNTYPNPGWADCLNVSSLANTSQENPSNLHNVFLEGYSNYATYSGKDVNTVCDQFNCWSVSASDTVLNLYKVWNHAEWNVFGYCCLSIANFNSGISITVRDYFYAQNQAQINPTCTTGAGYTGEQNNLNYGGTCSTGTGYYAFTETH